jgi:hypothetical protein
MGFLYEHQRTTAGMHVVFDCPALDEYPAVQRIIPSIEGREAAFRPYMTLNDKMHLV